MSGAPFPKRKERSFNGAAFFQSGKCFVVAIYNLL
jgi:hypothetical protein